MRGDEIGEPNGEGRESVGDMGKRGESRLSPKKLKEDVEEGEEGGERVESGDEHAGVAGDEGLEEGTEELLCALDPATRVSIQKEETRRRAYFWTYAFVLCVSMVHCPSNHLAH